MLTIFTTCRPFEGKFAIHQQNALTSWSLLEPKPEIILFGVEPGSEETAREIGLRYAPYVTCDKFGLPRLDLMFDRAQLLANNNTLAWINADIILVEGFMEAVRRCARHNNGQFLMVCRRYNIDLDVPLDFNRGWRATVQRAVCDSDGLYSPCSSDLFAFNRPLWKMPPFRVGRPRWDNWMMWKACERGVPVVDVSEIVTAAHPLHGFGENGATENYKAFHKGASSARNKELISESQKYCLKHVRRAGNLWRLLPEKGITKA